MIKKLSARIPLLATDKEPVWAILPTKTLILFPGETVSLQVGRPSNIRLIEDYFRRGDLIGITFAPGGYMGDKNFTLCQVGTAAKILSVKPGPGNSQMISLEGTERISLQYLEQTEPYVKAGIAFIQESVTRTARTDQLCKEIIAIIERITALDPLYSTELSYIMKFNLDNPGSFADRVTAAFHFPIHSKQQILEAYRAVDRLRKVLKFLKEELDRITISTEIKQNVEERSLEQQRRFYLQQQLYEIKRQLGDEFVEDKVSQQLKKDIKRNTTLPSEVRDKAYAEAERLGQLSSASAEFAATKMYIDWLLGVPWNIYQPDTYDLIQVEKSIDKMYFGSAQTKRRILERLAVRLLSGGKNQGPVLCLAGAPGTGKASLARAIATALGKKFARISVGGLVDLADIKGQPRTYFGANPGIIVRTLKELGVSDPVILVEDIEYFAGDANTALPLALLEAIDPRYNSNFLDYYIGLPIDLSKAIFICSIKSPDDMPETFAHRFEIVELPGYIEREKIFIARKYIIPQLQKKHGFKKNEVTFTQKGLETIIRFYTLEAGLLNLTRQIERVFRYLAREKASKVRKVWNITERTVEDFLGTPIYIPEKPDKQSEIGVAVGLAWTGVGGDLMIIEGLRMPGNGEVISTGSLGDVMRESIQAAHSYVRSKADILGIDPGDFSNFDMHIHFPSGAIPKDGPSAGVTVSLVMASLMAERPIRNDVAMTGEVTLRGKVLPVGGVKEKVSAAYRAGIRTVLLPTENAKDLKDLPPDVLKKTRFIFIDKVDQLFEQALLDFVPSSYTLEKMFAAEIEKVKNRKKNPPARKIAAKGRKKHK